MKNQRPMRKSAAKICILVTFQSDRYNCELLLCGFKTRIQYPLDWELYTMELNETPRYFLLFWVIDIETASNVSQVDSLYPAYSEKERRNSWTTKGEPYGVYITSQRPCLDVLCWRLHVWVISYKSQIMWCLDTDLTPGYVQKRTQCALCLCKCIRILVEVISGLKTKSKQWSKQHTLSLNFLGLTTTEWSRHKNGTVVWRLRRLLRPW